MCVFAVNPLFHLSCFPAAHLSVTTASGQIPRTFSRETSLRKHYGNELIPTLPPDNPFRTAQRYVPHPISAEHFTRNPSHSRAMMSVVTIPCASEENFQAPSFRVNAWEYKQFKPNTQHPPVGVVIQVRLSLNLGCLASQLLRSSSTFRDSTFSHPLPGGPQATLDLPAKITREITGGNWSQPANSREHA